MLSWRRGYAGCAAALGYFQRRLLIVGEDRWNAGSPNRATEVCTVHRRRKNAGDFGQHLLGFTSKPQPCVRSSFVIGDNCNE